MTTEQQVKTDTWEGRVHWEPYPEEEPVETLSRIVAEIDREARTAIRQLRTDLAQEQLINKANTETLTWLKAAFDTVRNAGDLRAPLPVGGGSRADKPLFGYQGVGDRHNCLQCGEPASEHGCPEVKEG